MPVLVASIMMKGKKLHTPREGNERNFFSRNIVIFRNFMQREEHLSKNVLNMFIFDAYKPYEC